MAIYRCYWWALRCLSARQGMQATRQPRLELVFITLDYCPFCKAWERRLALPIAKPLWPKAPLRRLNIADVQAVLPDISPKVKGTPAFLLLSENKEIGRKRAISPEMFTGHYQNI